MKGAFSPTYRVKVPFMRTEGDAMQCLAYVPTLENSATGLDKGFRRLSVGTLGCPRVSPGSLGGTFP